MALMVNDMTEIRYTSEEKRLLENNSKITLVTPCTVVLSVDFHKEIYDGWKVARTEQVIREILIRNVISADMLGERYIAAIQWDLREQGNPYSFHAKSEERVKNIALVASGKFQPRRRSISWLPEFKEELCNNYPVQSFEDGIRRAGLTPELVGSQRLRNLKHSCKVKMERRQRALEGKLAKEELSERELDRDEGDQDAYVYYGHPYVKDVSGHKSITMSDTFYNEACVMNGMPVEELLEIYGIDAGLLSATCQSQIRCQLSVWERTDEVQGLENEQILRIRAARLCAMIRYTEEGFRTIREAAGKLSPLQKKELCREISGYPTAPDHPGGYSLRQILLKVGISKTTYYRALYDSSYGRSEERRRELDKRDLETVMTVVRYKGYEKGIRQIYMLMPSLTGPTFAISKIRRLLRQAGIRTRVRGENPARKRAVRFHERNTKPNLLKRELSLHRPNEVRLTDVFYCIAKINQCIFPFRCQIYKGFSMHGNTGNKFLNICHIRCMIVHKSDLLF